MKRLGNTSEQIPSIGIGTWGMHDRESEEAIRYAIEHNAGLIDTAEMYGTEDLVGRSIRNYDRQNLFIISKVWPTHLRHDDVLKACDASLKRLGTTYIDLYLVHWPSQSVPIAETMKAFEELANMGKIRHLGVSNFSIEQFEEAQASLSRYDLVANEIRFNVLDKQEALEFEAYAEKNKITVIAYSPLARGIENLKQNAKAYEALDRLAEKYGKSIAQVALNWIIQHDSAVAIPKASSLAHAKENIEAADFSLSNEEVALLDRL